MDHSTSREKRVDFVVAGAQKSATRALGRFLSQHPEIGLTRDEILEPHFFDQKELFNSHINFDVYHDYFSPESLAKTTGDITPNYLYWKTAIPNIRIYNPDMKIIVLLREPAQRAYSQWVMQIESGKEQSRFLWALLKEPFRWIVHGQHRNYSYIQRGYYSRQVKRLYAYFPKEQCLILRTKDLREDHNKTMHRVFQFLGVESCDIPKPETIHSRTYTPIHKLSKSLLKLLFRRDIVRLEKILKWDCSEWKI